jgi:O-antigen/teichoic acid export membrane protein
MMARPSALFVRVPAYLQRARSDSLVRNSLYIMASTVVTAGLGYIFWIAAAHAFTRREVGTGSAVISLCSTTALLTYLGSSAILIERLPTRERSADWTTILVRMCLMTSAVTVAVTAAAVPVLLTSPDYRLFFSSALPIFMAVLGAAAWTLVNLLGAAFIAARRAGRLLAIQTLISASKLLFVLPLAAARLGAMGLVEAWVASTILGVGVGAGWLVPRMRLGHRPGPRAFRRAPYKHDFRLHRRQRPRHRRVAALLPTADFVRLLAGQHLTSVGGAMTPLILPIVVVLRLGVTQNAYFYITEMMGAAFFMVSPSVATAVFAEGVRARSDLGGVVARALRVIAVMLVPAMAVMIVGGRLILGLFGASYAAAGYGLLILLAISALPDAVSNVAVAVFRVTHRLGYSAALNLGMLLVTVAGAWILMPRLGIAGVGVAWLGAQIFGALASLPAYRLIREPMASSASAVSHGEKPVTPTSAAGIAQLIDLAERQALDRLSGRLL